MYYRTAHAHTPPPPHNHTTGRPTPPTKLGAAFAGNFSLNISWVPPFSLPGVSIWYSIFVDGNVTALVAGRSYYVYRYTGNSPCQKHNITAVAGNAAGDSDPSEPLLSDIPEGECKLTTISTPCMAPITICSLRSVGQFVAAPNSMVVLNNVTLILILKVLMKDCQLTVHVTYTYSRPCFFFFFRWPRARVFLFKGYTCS